MKKLTFFFILISTFVKSQTLPSVCFNAMNSANTASVGTNPISVINADFNADGNADLAVANYSSNNVSVLMGSGTGSFALAVNYNVGSLPYAVTSGDFNNDGKPDLAICNSGSNNVSVLFNLGTGTFGSATNYAVGTNPRAITSGDFNSDGKADLAVANYSTNNVSVLLNTGTGTFTTAVNYAVGANPTSLTNADFDGDGKKDLMVANSNSAFVSLLLGSTTGSFSTASNLTVPAAANCVINADFNNDGKTDIAMTNSVNFVVLLGTGTGSVSATITTTVLGFGSNPLFLSGADYNNDGIIDITVYGSINLRILIGSGTGAFSTLNSYWVYYGYSLNTTNTDFNNDGYVDIVCIGGFENSYSTLLGYGNGTFLYSYTGFDIGVGVAGVTIDKADFNGDGNLDIVTGGGFNLGISAGLGNGTFLGSYFGVTYFIPYGLSLNVMAISVADFNNDSKMDVAYYGYPGGPSYNSIIQIMLGTGTGSLTLGNSYTLATVSPGKFTNSDFNNDGNIDLAITNYTANSVSLLIGNGAGSFTTGPNFGVGSSPQSLTASDFNNDGKKDLAVANYSSNSISILIGTGTGSFLPAVNYSVGSNPICVISKDFNNDGNYDLAVANYSSNNTYILLGSSTGTFAFASNYNLLNKPYSLTSNDFNGDGKLDLAIINGGYSNFQGNSSILLGIGNGSFVPSTSYAVGTNASEIISDDFNNDGKIDIVNGNSNGLLFSVLLNGAVLGINSTNTVCSGSAVNLSAYGASTFTWSTGANTNSISVSPTSTTNYSLTGMSINGCVGSAVKTVSVVSCPVGLKDNSSIESELIKVFPTPTNGILNVEIDPSTGSGSASATNVQILNTLGQIVQTTHISNQITQINIQQFNSGIYFIKVMEGNKVVATQKVIKE